MGRSGLLACGVSHRGGCAWVLPVLTLCILDVVKEESKNNPLEIKIISVNRRQRVVFPVFCADSFPADTFGYDSSFKQAKPCLEGLEVAGLWSGGA